MKKFLLAVLMIFAVIALASCSGEAPQEILTEDFPEKQEEIFRKAENYAEETLPEKQKPEKKDPPEEIISEPQEEAENRPESSEEDEPIAKDIIGIDTDVSDNEPVSSKQLEYILGFLEEEKWEKADGIENGKTEFSGTIFHCSNGGFIAVNFYDEEKAFILKKWGEGQKYRAYYFAPKEAAEFAELFRIKTEESAKSYDRWEDVSKFYPEYDDRLSYFGSGLNESYGGDDYISETPYLCMLFDHAYRLEKSFGRMENDEYYPIYPAEFVEELLGKYYLFSAEEIRGMAGKYGYDPENETYNMEGGYGGAYPIPRVTEVRENEELLELYVDLHSAVDDYHIERSSILTVRPNPDGSWQYLGNKIYFEVNYDKFR